MNATGIYMRLGRSLLWMLLVVSLAHSVPGASIVETTFPGT